MEYILAFSKAKLHRSPKLRFACFWLPFSTSWCVDNGDDSSASFLKSNDKDKLTKKCWQYFTQPFILAEILLFLKITKPFLTDTGNKMALIKIRLNLLKSQKSTKIAFAYLCSSSGSFLSFDELAATWGISWSSISCFFWRIEKCDKRPKWSTYLKLSSVLVQLTAGCLPELHMFRICD